MTAPELKALNLLAEIYPHYFSSFYTRGKLINGRIPGAEATLIIDLIKQCSFGCAFCFACDTQNRGRMFAPEQLRELLRNLVGIPKIVLIGGEPFEHPRMDEVLEIVAAVAVREVEIFTNGAVVPSNAAQADAWLEGRLAIVPAEKLTLTLAADLHHKRIHGPARFAALLDNFIRWGARGLRTRFNITDGRIYTSDYMDLPAMRAVMADLSPVLAREFEDALVGDRLTDRFYLNPLVAQGRQDADAPGVEFLRPADMLFSPELVLTLDRDGAPQYRAALNAAWMENPPECMVSGPAQADLLPLIVERVAAPRLGADDAPSWQAEFFAAAAVGRPPRSSDAPPDNPFYGELLAAPRAELFAAQALWGGFDLVCRDRAAFFARLAEKLWRIIEKPQPFVWDLSGFYNIDRVGLPVLRILLQKLAARGDIGDAFYARLLDIWRPFIEGGANPPQPCAVFERRNLGRLPEERGGCIPLHAIALHSGFADWPRESDYVIKPRLLLPPDGQVQYGFDARIEWLPGDGSQDSAARLLDFFTLLLPPEINAESRRRLLAAAQPDSPLPHLLRTCAADDPFISQADFFFSDPEKLFKYAVFDRNSDSLPYGNKALLHHLLQYDLEAFDPVRAAAWRDKLNYHLGRGGDACEVDLSQPDAAGCIEKAVTARHGDIRFSGAELAARSDFADIMRRLVKEGLQFSIESDGVLFARRRIAERMQRFGLRRATVRIYGGTRFAHQLIKGQDDFYRVLDGIRNLADSGVTVEVRLKATDYNRGTLRLAAVEMLKCGIRPDEALIFEDGEPARFASEIREAREYARKLAHPAQTDSRPPLCMEMEKSGQRIELDTENCRLKSAHDAGLEAMPPDALLLRAGDGLYDKYIIRDRHDEHEIVYAKNVRSLVFVERDGLRYRLRPEPACAACRHLTRCAAAFAADAEPAPDFTAFGGEYPLLDVSAPNLDISAMFARLEPGQRIAVGARLRHVVLDAETHDNERADLELAALCDLAYAHGLEPVDYELSEQSGSERYALLYEKPAAAPPRVDRMAVTNISSACVANCIMCSMPQVFRGHAIHSAGACALFEELKICGFQMIDIFGGEISLRGDLLTLVRSVKSLNMISNMISTGYRLTKEYVTALVEAGLDKVEISLDSPDAPLHDEIRRREGLFEHACAAIENFKEAGRVLLEVNTVILPHNVDQMRRLNRMVVETLGVPHHRMFYCVQIPTALTAAQHLSVEQARRYFEEDYPELLKYSRESGAMLDFCPQVNPDEYPDKDAFYAEISAGRYLKNSHCEAPQRDLFVTPEGAIYPCVNPAIINRIKPLGFFGRDKIIAALHSEAMRSATRDAGMWPECASCISKR